jgi:serine/threonine protein kinase
VARIVGVVLSAVVAAGCKAPPIPVAPGPLEGRFVDLTYAFDEGTIYWPTEPGFRLERVAFGFTPAGYFYAANRLCAAESCRQDPDYRLRVDDFLAWEERNGRIPRGAIVLRDRGRMLRASPLHPRPDEDDPGVNLLRGTRLGPYEILGPLGAGGMGEVYAARDTRLGRDVALKVLPPHLSASAGARARFEREARAISSLNHPHICTLYDVGEREGTAFLVMERIEGETLATRLERGPLKFEKARRVAAEIADALAAAHRKGVVHRDLKPGNVMLTKSGVKVLDFGLAKLREEAGPREGQPTGPLPTGSPTRTTPLTSEGALVGAMQYMAPEQLEGKPANHRADLFSFGAVLYEMLTGRRAFEGSSQASVIAAILEREPRPIRELQPLVPPALDGLVRACLVKDPDERIQTAHDIRLQLQWIAEAIASPDLSGAGVPRVWSQRSSWLVLSGAALALLLAGGLAVRLALRQPTSPEAPALHLTLPAGPPKSICEASEDYDGAWGGDGTILFTQTGRLYRVSAAGGQPSLFPGLDWSDGGPSVHAPTFLPDRRSFLVWMEGPSEGQNGLYMGSIDRPGLARIEGTEDIGWPEFSDGYLLSLRRKTLVAREFDDRTRKVMGPPLPLAEGEIESVSASQNGVLIYTIQERGPAQLTWYDRAGLSLGTVGEAERYIQVALSPDGTQAVVEDTSCNVLMLDLAREVTTRLTGADACEGDPVWAPDGRSLVFHADRGTETDLWMRSLVGAGRPFPLLESNEMKWSEDVSRDGKYLAYLSHGDTWTLPLTSERKPVLYLKGQDNKDEPHFSPDGRWMAWESWETGGTEVYLGAFPTPGVPVRISAKGGGSPAGEPTGKSCSTSRRTQR